MNMNVYMPTKFISGKDCIINNTKEFKKLGNACLIMTGKHSAKACGALGDVIQALDKENISYIVYDGIGQNPKLVDCMEAGTIAYDNKVDFIVGIGGGSPLDAAKCAAVFASNEGLDREGLYSLDWPNTPLPIIAVGTTAGTGSEVTKVSVITTPEGTKKSFHHEDVFPKVAFGDPKYTLTLNDHFTRSTAIDALAHCMESYFTRSANEISMAYSIRGIRILLSVFRKMKEEYTLTYEDRENLYNASIYGGLAINVTGTCFPHNMGYLLTEQHGLPHGIACAAFMSDFYFYNKEVMPTLTTTFLKEIDTTEEEFLSLVDCVLPTFEVVMDEEEITREHNRWINNGSLKKAWGDFDADKADALLRKKFIK